MIEEVGKVVAVDDGSAWVETLRQSACDACSAKAGCGHSALAKLGQKTHHIRANCEYSVAVGDRVVVGVPEDIMVRSSILAYMLPLVLMIVLAVTADHYWSQEWLTVVAAGAGLVVGFGVLRWHFKRYQTDPRYQPVVLRPLGSGGNVAVCP